MTKEKDENLDFEIQFYEGILKKKPDFVQALMALGDLYTKKGLHEKGLKVDEKLQKLRPDDSTVLYNLACSYSLINRIDESLKMMKMAIECGYDDFKYLEEDDDLSNLRRDGRFEQVISLMKLKLRKQGHKYRNEKK